MSVTPNKNGRGRPVISIGGMTATEARAESKKTKADAKAAFQSAKLVHKGSKAAVRTATMLANGAKKAYEKNRKDDALKDAHLSAQTRLKEANSVHRDNERILARAEKYYVKSVEKHNALEAKIKAKSGK